MLNMSGCRFRLKLLTATVLCSHIALQVVLVPQTALWSGTMAADQDAKHEGGKVAGILIDKKEDWITVKADGEDEPTKYLVAGDAGKKVREDLKSIFNACRVQITYKQESDSRHLVGIKRQILKASGTVTGNVVKVYNDFWVEVKPKHGVADAFAPGANYNDKNFMEKLKGLKPGDTVTITFTTDFERHRIKTLRKHAASQTKPAGSTPSTAPETRSEK